jgi:hypothetical protein
MRTTITLDDDVFEAAKAYADTRSIALGKAVSDLARKGLYAKVPTKKLKNGLLVFDPPSGSPPVTAEHVKQLESEME